MVKGEGVEVAELPETCISNFLDCTVQVTSTSRNNQVEPTKVELFAWHSHNVCKVLSQCMVKKTFLPTPSCNALLAAQFNTWTNTEDTVLVSHLVAGWTTRPLLRKKPSSIWTSDAVELALA
jgi:hypothetical protein